MTVLEMRQKIKLQGCYVIKLTYTFMENVYCTK